MRSRISHPIIALFLLSSCLAACTTAGPSGTATATAKPQGQDVEPDQTLVQVQAVISRIAASEKTLSDNATALLRLAAANPSVTTTEPSPVPKPSPSGYSSTPVTSMRVVENLDGTKTMTLNSRVNGGLYTDDTSQTLQFAPGSPVRPVRFTLGSSFSGEGTGSGSSMTKEWGAGDSYFQSLNLAWKTGTDSAVGTTYNLLETGVFTGPRVGRTVGTITVQSVALTLARTLTASGGTFEIGFPNPPMTVSGTYDAAGTPARTVTVKGPNGTAAIRQLP